MYRYRVGLAVSHLCCVDIDFGHSMNSLSASYYHLVLLQQRRKAVVSEKAPVVFPRLSLPPLFYVGLQPHQRLVPLHVAHLEQQHPDGHEQPVVGPVQARRLFVPELGESALFVLAVESPRTSFQNVTFALKYLLSRRNKRAMGPIDERATTRAMNCEQVITPWQ